MPLLLKSCDELYISSIPYAFILILFFALLTKCPPLYHQIVNNFSVFCNLFWTIRPLFGQILITCFKNFNAWLSSFSYWQKGKTCTGVDVVECIFCIVPFHWLIFSFFYACDIWDCKSDGMWVFNSFIILFTFSIFKFFKRVIIE